MDIVDAIATRRSVRGFLGTPVPRELLERVLTQAARAASGGNVQPWQLYVLSGVAMDQFKDLIEARVNESPGGEFPLEYDIYPGGLKPPYRDYRFKNGEDLYATLGIPREDKMARLLWLRNNFRFFGAPAALFCFIDRQMGPPQWSDLGMFLQNVMLLLRAEGLHSCAQECWSLFHASVRGYFGAPEEWMLFCGMAIGYEDPAQPVNRLRADRAPLSAFCRFVE